jgi:N-methylhydantoinase B
MSIADRSILACWGVKGGKAGKPFQVTVDPGGPDEHEVDALADAEPLKAGTVVRIRTTGGGGWGDPLERPVEEVLRDIAWRKVSVAGAREDYGVVVTAYGATDARATEELRASMRAARTGEEPFFDRGPGYATLSGGAAFNEFDVL